MTFTNRPGRAAMLAGERPGVSIEDRGRGRIGQEGRADLYFMVNDHSIMPDGRLKAFGRVQNRGGATAAQARIRVRILLDNGNIAAQGETPLDPSTIPPQGMATFELPLDYSGPVGTIKAELVWVE